MMLYFRRKALLDALNILEEKEQNTVIYITPPTNSNGDITDEDSGDENSGGLIDNLSKNQLEAEAELDEQSETEEDEENTPLVNI